MTEQEAKILFGNSLRDNMMKYGLTRQELSRITGIQPTAISQYMTGVSFPPYQAVISLVTALGCRYDELIPFHEHID